MVVLLAILSVVALPRMVQPGTFTPATLTQAIVSQGRAGAQAALAQPQALVRLQVQRLSGQWRIQLLRDGNVQQQALIAEADVAVHVNNAGSSYTLQAGDTLDVRFAPPGQIITAMLNGSGVPALVSSQGVGLLVQGDSSRHLCIYPNGYVSARACA
ncbi:MAG: hypothetical protein AAF993_03660 [Pseudomonadota bacterium]